MMNRTLDESLGKENLESKGKRGWCKEDRSGNWIIKWNSFLEKWDSHGGT